MVAIGLTRMVAARVSLRDANDSSVALSLCIVGLIGVFAIGYAGYFVFDAFWPSFYYSPITAAKNAWLLGQALFIAVYFVGTVVSFVAVRRALDAIPAPAA
jgi:cation transporter-like permease